MIKDNQLLTQKVTSQSNSDAESAYEMDDGPLSIDFIAKINEEASKYIPTDEQPIETTSLF